MKLGRPPLKNAQKKVKLTALRLRSDERELLEKAAANRREKLSQWMRNVLVGAATSELKLETSHQ
jgi:uncharacterized protein (DUF1778 family)